MARSLRTRFLETLRARLGGEKLPLRIIFWDGEAFDFAAAPRVTLTLASRRLIRRFLLGDIDGLGAAYVKGEIGVEGRIEDVLAIGIRIAERLGASPALRRIGQVGALMPRRRFRHTRQRDAEAVGYHYDVSNDFYRLWLDRNMVYSCAYFATGEEDLDTAQEQKLDHLCRKLRLKPGERLLDIGCGWGGLLILAAQRYDIEGVGVTLSREQHALATERVAAAGLAARIEIRLQDYRDIPGEGVFDKIASVGMFEHVGRANLPLYFATIHRLLKPGGLAMNHGITAVRDRDSRGAGPAGGGFLDRYVFPDGELAHVSRVLYEMAGAALE
ncbi:MAG: class I SAM-dependent methyltransferase, partial [Stellaceae bacterium]